jgi:hypothetical protein
MPHPPVARVDRAGVLVEAVARVAGTHTRAAHVVGRAGVVVLTLDPVERGAHTAEERLAELGRAFVVVVAIDRAAAWQKPNWQWSFCEHGLPSVHGFALNVPARHVPSRHGRCPCTIHVAAGGRGAHDEAAAGRVVAEVIRAALRVVADLRRAAAAGAAEHVAPTVQRSRRAVHGAVLSV